MSQDIVVIGAGPAGLAAAYELGEQGQPAVVLEKDGVIGGLSRTVVYKGFRCDIGGHRFFTKSDYVDKLWHKVLGPDFLRRPRLSRIYTDGKFYNYPLQISNVLANLGVGRSLAVTASYLAAKLRPFKKDDTFTQWVSNRFGRKLFNMFFKAYTEKIWGISTDELSGDWAAQRIRNLSAGKAILNALGLKGRKVASLIEQFDYPALGPGQMYEAMARQAADKGAAIELNHPVLGIERSGGRIVAAFADDGKSRRRYPVGKGLFSSMPLDELVLAVTPAAPSEVLEAARSLTYRSLITVNLLLNQADITPDTWVYIHDSKVRAGRLQLYKNWSPHMVPDPGQSVIGLEYFSTVGDELWRLSDEKLTAMAKDDLRAMNFVDGAAVFDSFVVRYAKAYPVYKAGYAGALRTIRQFLGAINNLYPIGRYGQFRYNNMDHSILTAQLSVQKMNGVAADPWSVNVEEAGYLEEKKTP